MKKFHINWLGAPYFAPEENEELGYTMKRDALLETSRDDFTDVDDEYFCSIVGESVMIPLQEGDCIEADMFFQAYMEDEKHGICHQEISVCNVKKVTCEMRPMVYPRSNNRKAPCEN